jgi:predicted TIM-barrel fold metal-dependent hydrolase
VAVVDFFCFPLPRADEAALFDFGGIDFAARLAELRHPAIAHRQVALFDPERIDAAARAAGDGFSFAALAPLGRADAEERLARAKVAGVRTVVFHPYLQDVDDDRTGAAAALALRASRLGFVVAVCTAWGSRKIYRIDPLKVALAVAGTVTTPVVLVHGGGGRAREAMLIADAFPHVRLETSFSLSYWAGSPVEDDLAFAVRKLGAHRVVFGSDAPFVDTAKALDDHRAFLDRHRFTAAEAERIMGGTAAELLGI